MKPWLLIRWIFVGFLGGLFLGAFADLFWWGACACVFLSFCLLWGWRWWRVVLLVSLLASVYTSWRISLLQTDLQSFLGEKISFEGVVMRFPEKRHAYWRVYVKPVCIRKDDICEDISLKEQVLVRVPLGIDMRYGDRLFITGTLRGPRSFGSFDYRQYLERFWVFSLVEYPTEIDIIQRNQGKLLWQRGYQVREIFSQKVSDALPFPHNVIGTGVLLGVKELLPRTLDGYFRDSGLQHILVVSGFNVAVIGFLVLFFCRRFGRIISRSIAIGSLVFFLIITGGDPPVLRAVIMGCIVLFAGMSGNSGNAKTLLLLTACLMGFWNPLMVTRDISFQLSFMATGGILAFAPFLEKCFEGLSLWLRKVLSITLAAQLAVFPVIGWYFEVFPWSGIVANVVVEPFVPLIMLGAFLSGGFGFVFPLVAEGIGILTEGLITGLFWITRFFASWGQVEVGGWFVILMGGVILGLMGLSFLGEGKEKN